jgi:hypothetical protein
MQQDIGTAQNTLRFFLYKHLKIKNKQFNQYSIVLQYSMDFKLRFQFIFILSIY